MKIYHLALIVSTGLAFASAKADTLSIVLDAPAQSGSPGDLVQFFGTITNNTGSPLDLSLATENFSLTGFNALTDLTDLGNVPPSLGAGASSADVELFDITIPNPFTDPCIAALDCGGTYQILDANGAVLGTAFFTVNIPTSVPEPSSAALLSGVLLLLLVVGKRYYPRAARRTNP